MKRIGVRSSGIPSSVSPSRIPALDGSPAKLGGSPARCTLCGATGHGAREHVGGKAVVKASPDMNEDPTPSGEAISQDQATQFGTNKSSLTTGNANYKSPGGGEGGMS